MKINNVELETAQEKEKWDDDLDYFLYIKVKIPGGEATYKIKIDKNVKESLEKAVNLK